MYGLPRGVNGYSRSNSMGYDSFLHPIGDLFLGFHGDPRIRDASREILCSNSSTRGDCMPLNIRNEQAEELATALVKLTGETKTEAVTQALRERLERVRRTRSKRRLADDLDEIALHCSGLPVRDSRSADSILGYDDDGLPR
jgi:antitoxin VapB